MKAIALALAMLLAAVVYALAEAGDIRIAANDDNSIRSAFELAVLLGTGEKIRVLPQTPENDKLCKEGKGQDFRAFGFTLASSGPHALCIPIVWNLEQAQYMCESLASDLVSFDEKAQVVLCRIKPSKPNA